MASNHLEQLLAEWYEYQGYFVRRNVLVGKRLRGGYECELDVVAFHPLRRHVIHLEPSLDTVSWDDRERRYTRKFAAGRKYIPDLLSGFGIAEDIEQVAVLAFTGRARRTVGGGRVEHVRDVLLRVMAHLSDKPLMNAMVPEQYPLLRTLQFVGEYRREVAACWHGATAAPRT